MGENDEPTRNDGRGKGDRRQDRRQDGRRGRKVFTVTCWNCTVTWELVGGHFIEQIVVQGGAIGVRMQTVRIPFIPLDVHCIIEIGFSVSLFGVCSPAVFCITVPLQW